MPREDEPLFELLVRVRTCRRGAGKGAYSREDGRTLWDGGDRVEHADAGAGGEQYSFYVTLHHFGGEAAGRIGQHVALAPRRSRCAVRVQPLKGSRIARDTPHSSPPPPP